MNTFCIFLIIVTILLLRAGSKKNRIPGNPSGEMPDSRYPGQMDMKDIKRYKAPSDKPKKTLSKTVERAKKRVEKPVPAKDPGDDQKVTKSFEPLTDIEVRRAIDHQEMNNSRIHKNTHMNMDNYTEDKVDMMRRVRDLIACGYPVEIPGQRDFVKEGEDFLNSLGSDNIFV